MFGLAFGSESLNQAMALRHGRKQRTYYRSKGACFMRRLAGQRLQQ
jgi:hypothetical protein